MAFFKKDELKHLKLFYLERFISLILWFAPAFWVLQFQQTLSLFQIGILFATLSITSFLLEIPTGAFADIYGRKASVLLGYFLGSVGFILLYFTSNFYLLILIFAFWGFTTTFISGAHDAWVIDNLKFYKRENLIKEFYIKSQSIAGFGLVLSGLLGAFIVGKLELNSIWIFAFISFLLTGLILTFVKEHKITEEKKQSFKQVFLQSKKAIKFAVNHQIILLILLATFFIMIRDSFGGELVWQPFLKDLGFPTFAFGILFSIFALATAFSSLYASKLLKKFKNERNYLVFLLICTIVLNILMFFVNNYYLGIILLMLTFIAISLFMPIGNSYFQNFVPSKMRATITSLNGMVISLAYTIGQPLAGLTADAITPKYTLILGAIFLIPPLIFYLKIKNK